MIGIMSSRDIKCKERRSLDSGFQATQKKEKEKTHQEFQGFANGLACVLDDIRSKRSSYLFIK
jgi:hypothetical protein